MSFAETASKSLKNEKIRLKEKLAEQKKSISESEFKKKCDERSEPVKPTSN